MTLNMNSTDREYDKACDEALLHLIKETSRKLTNTELLCFKAGFARGAQWYNKRTLAKFDRLLGLTEE